MHYIINFPLVEFVSFSYRRNTFLEYFQIIHRWLNTGYKFYKINRFLTSQDRPVQPKMKISEVGQTLSHMHFKG